MLPAVRSLPRFETLPKVVRWVQTPAGRVLLVVLFCAMAVFHGLPAIPLCLALSAVSLLPQRRRILIAAATLFWLLGRIPGSWAALVVVFVAMWLVLSLFQVQPGHSLFRHPIRNLLVLYIALLAAASYVPVTPFVKATLWAALAIAGKYLWFLCYALSDKKGVTRQSPLLTLSRFQPFWGSSNVPFPKGEANLDRIEAKNDEQLAICQLRGIELMIWSTFLLAALAFLDWWTQHPWPAAIYSGSLHWPTRIVQLNEAIECNKNGMPLPRWDCWLAVLANFVRKILVVSTWGNTIIATCRMAGFNAVRNTRKPLSSTTIAEFYNRLYYYFKELLVTFFFYPWYFRFFKKHPRVRVFVATLAAAGFGNALFHFLRDIDYITQFGIGGALVRFQVYLVYTLLLGVAIAISQLRSLGGHAHGGAITGPLVVLAFYCLVMILDDPRRDWTIRVYFSFIVNLFLPFSR